MDYPCSDGELPDDCRDYCLFDIVKDPEERKDLLKSEPDVMKMIWSATTGIPRNQGKCKIRDITPKQMCPLTRMLAHTRLNMEDTGAHGNPQALSAYIIVSC